MLSIVVFDRDQKNIKKITESLAKLPKNVQNKLEFVLVVFNKRLTAENEQHALSLRRFMRVTMSDYMESHPESDAGFYACGKNFIVRPYDHEIVDDDIKMYLEK